MEEKVVSFTGITQSTSDLDCRDGDLSISHNIINQDGAMRPIVVPDVAFSIEVGEQLLYVHKGDGFKNYFVIDSSSLLFFTDDNKIDRHTVISLDGRNITQIVAIGNSVAILLDDGIEYLLYKEGKYKVLGSKPPELQISFGLVGGPYQASSPINIDCSSNKGFGTDDALGLSRRYVFDASTADSITNTIMGKANEEFALHRKANRFTHPFLVCYAYKLLGQTDYMVSPPVVMRPVSSGSYPLLPISNIRYSDNYRVTYFSCSMLIASCYLDYHIKKDLLDKLNDWKDIITSVDIYVSPEIPLSDGNVKISSLVESRGLNMTNWVECNFGTSTKTYYSSVEEYNKLKPIYAEQGCANHVNTQIVIADVPHYESEEVDEKIRNTSNFYLFKSYKVEELKTEEIIRPEEEGILESIATQTELKAVQDYNSHDILSADKAVVYNGRLHLSGVKKKFFGFAPSALVPFNNGVRTTESILSDDNYQLETYDYRFTYLIKEDGKIVKTIGGLSTLNNVDEYLFYPNPNVVKVLVEMIKSTETLYSEVLFKSHVSLNDSVSIEKSRTYNKTYNTADYEVGTQAYDYNKIYTSDVNSIFNFPLSGRTTIGTGVVYGVSAISKALSPGQFGQFPLYAFSSEGVYAMEVNPNTGLFSSVHLISRDVCNNSDSITQIDGAVLFTSEKGVLLVDGSEVRPISAEMDGANFNITNVEQLNAVLSKEGVLEEIGSIVRFSDFISNCQIAFDYPNNRILLFRADMAYAYVYSLNSRSWATMSANFKKVVTDYPNVYILSNNSSVYDLFEKVNYDSGKVAKTIIVSRPLKFGNAEFKSINTIINRGILQKNRGGIILFASLDGLTYFPIGSAVGCKLTRLQGSPYRYFRLAIVGEMAVNEALSMSSIFVTSKWLNKPR